MAAGDVSLTFTIPGTTSTVFVSGSRTGRGADDTHGTGTRSRGTAAHDVDGTDAQEDNGRPERGQTGSIS